jgi:hypothetical protein
MKNPIAHNRFALKFPKNVLVVGAPRSGTSLTAAAFARAGWHVGERKQQHIREGDDGNPFGYFEADELVERNVEVLRAAGYPHHNTWIFDEISEESIRRIESMQPTAAHRRFIERCDKTAPWMWKDPRLCFTLSYWWKLMDPFRTRVVLVRRGFEQIHNSFVRRNWCTTGREAREQLRRRIERHLQAAEDAIRSQNIPVIEINYEDCISQPQAMESWVAAFCGAPRETFDLNALPRLNHSTARGRVAARVRRSLDAGVLRRIKFMKPLIPAWLLSVMMPEKRFERSSAE